MGEGHSPYGTAGLVAAVAAAAAAAAAGPCESDVPDCPDESTVTWLPLSVIAIWCPTRRLREAANQDTGSIRAIPRKRGRPTWPSAGGRGPASRLTLSLWQAPVPSEASRSAPTGAR